ncbi:efflux RND transporter periplasmic adaptor subunit [Labilibaculum sp. DW002]|uniref:Efflux RND transporter periplasmic adaptor subunit n=1 Tax=Paralabilibaculum antarcticum TaxID=2912572 RepID=A0ABT5VR78_9BACT|nr:efflux RND transporter periplasmic adaptor subunit [Labilibaculum sp. DW002]MDE5417933.1 efflux RND transporter periplasmic adaptor subunit [Labilibaculum sp. DW002]
MRIFLMLLCVFCLAVSCKPIQGKTDEESSKIAFREELNEVKTIKLVAGTFQKELVSNGKLRAFCKSDLYFLLSNVVKKLNVSNGDFVQKGEVLAVLDDFEQKNSLEESKQVLAKAELELADVLIGQGYNGQDTLEIPKEVLRISKLNSGFSSANLEYKNAQHDMMGTCLIAPFDGVVANLDGRIYDKTDISKPFCTLIDHKNFEVEFSVMESELRELRKGQRVKIFPFAFEKEYFGNITQINPVIEDNGLVKITARVNNKGGDLLEGMNVRVLIQNNLPNQLVVPKSAVLLRQNKEVVFTYKEGTAIWHYVSTGKENSSSYTIIEGLQAGDEVIVDGNLNLAHEAKVRVLVD